VPGLTESSSYLLLRSLVFLYSEEFSGVSWFDYLRVFTCRSSTFFSFLLIVPIVCKFVAMGT
jgi:hypothetical protein